MAYIKNIAAVAVIAYAIMLAAPRTLHDLSTICFNTAVLIAKIGIMLHPQGTWYDGGYDAGADEPTDRKQDA